MTVASTVIHSALVVSDGVETPDAWLAFADGRILARGSGASWRELHPEPTTIVDAAGRIVTPGFVDIHVHGGGGASVTDGVQAIQESLLLHRRHGTTRSVVSLVTAPISSLVSQLHEIREVMAADPLVIGSHLEGPFLAREFKGAHDPQLLVAPTERSVAELLAAADGTLRQVTLAPELPGGLDAVREFVRAGTAVAVGHTQADYDVARGAFDAGASILTHAFNGMKGIHHRAPGPVIAAIDDGGVSVELIGDGTHVAAPVARILASMVPGRLCLVTDAMAAAGKGDGDYLLGSLGVRVTNGIARLRDGDSIAGSTLTMDAALRFAVTELRLDLASAVAAVTSSPARALALEDRFGSLGAGYPADAVLLDKSLAVQRVWADGLELVTSRSPNA
jgi:N-acetylglucosamine-6-phosphate deacetylase